MLSNDILAALSQKEYQHFSDRLEPVQLNLNEILLEANQKCKSLYFPTQGVISLNSVMQNGSSTEIALIGQEGMVGILQFLGQEVTNNIAIVRIEGSAMRIGVKLLQEEFNQSKKLQKLLLSYALKLFNQVSQLAACNQRHNVKQRIARHLLMLDDRSDQEMFLITHQLLSKMLGVRRTGVTKVAKEIQRQGIINYHRGKMEILDREALKVIACECYHSLN